MNKLYKILCLISLSISINSCKKEPVLEIDENFEGSWRHYRTDVTYTEFFIQSDSKGEIEYIEENGMSSGTFTVKWLIKGDKLYHGWLATKHSVYAIDKYPTIAETEINNNFDFIPIGKSYMILDGEYYVRSN
jgi:hypothetical protein